MKRAIIIGATSGIGLALAKHLAAQNYILGLTGRRFDRLQEIQAQLPTKTHIKKMDVTEWEEASQTLLGLIQEMGGVDLMIISAGTGHVNENLDPALEVQTIDTNVTGFVALADTVMQHFIKKGHGHLVGISSIAALRGNGSAPAYNASKAFISNYMEGLRIKIFNQKLDITVTDIRPGFVDTAMAQSESLFWVASPEKAAQQIAQAISRKKNYAYITKRWCLIALLMKILPFSFYAKHF